MYLRRTTEKIREQLVTFLKSDKKTLRIFTYDRHAAGDRWEIIHQALSYWEVPHKSEKGAVVLEDGRKIRVIYK